MRIIIHHLDSKNDIQVHRENVPALKQCHFFRIIPTGLVRLAKPWLRLNWIYKWTNISSSEMERTQTNAEFIRMVCSFCFFFNQSGRNRIKLENRTFP